MSLSAKAVPPGKKSSVLQRSLKQCSTPTLTVNRLKGTVLTFFPHFLLATLYALQKVCRCSVFHSFLWKEEDSKIYNFLEEFRNLKNVFSSSNNHRTGTKG